MELGLHAGCIMHTNVVSDIRIAKAAGYDAIELWIPKLRRYFGVGNSANSLVPALGRLRVTMLNCMLSIERQDVTFRKGLRRDMAELSAVAQTIGCGAIQMIVLDGLKEMNWSEARRKIAQSLAELADIAAPYDVRLAVEPVVFSPFKTVRQALEIFKLAGRANIGLVIDTWHIWTAGVPWDDVAALDPALIVCAHLSDTNPKQGRNWHDDDRTALPGDGILPLREGIQAIRATGYDGVWSVEMLSHTHWEWEPELLALELKRRSENLLASSAESISQGRKGRRRL